MAINCTDPYQVTTINTTPLKRSTNFKYLGSQIPNSNTDFNYRKGHAWAANGKLTRIWKSTVPRKLKLNFFQASVESILLYGSETWTVTSELETRIDGCYTKLLRKVLNTKWQDHSTNDSLYQDLPQLSTKIKQRRDYVLQGIVLELYRSTCQPTSFFETSQWNNKSW